MTTLRNLSLIAIVDHAHRCPKHGAVLVVPAEARTDGRRLALRLGRKVCPLCKKKK